jgi:hypothetical protein
MSRAQLDESIGVTLIPETQDAGSANSGDYRYLPYGGHTARGTRIVTRVDPGFVD